MQKLIKESLSFVLESCFQENSIHTVKKIVESLNKKNLVIVGGMKNVGKISLLRDFIIKTGTHDSVFYFNKLLDRENTIRDFRDLEDLLQVYVSSQGEPKIIILHNINKVEGIKNFIASIYKEQNTNKKSKYKIILVGNSIKIEGIDEIEVVQKSSIEGILEGGVYIDDILQYGTLEKMKHISGGEGGKIKEMYLSFIKNDILVSDIFNSFSIKNIDLYNYTMSFLSYTNTFFSLRDLQKIWDSGKGISLKTTMDYIDFSLQSKIIRKMYKYDIKTGSHISSRAKYYFTDLGIRNSFNNFTTERFVLLENFVFNELYMKGWEVYGGMNGKFDFSFVAKRAGVTWYIHLSQESDRVGIKKEVRKLLKIGDSIPKYLIIQNKESLGIKKHKYDSVEIVSLKTFLHIIKGE